MSLDSDLDQPIIEATARAVVSSDSLESLARPFLDVLHSLTGLDSTYLTEVKTNEDKQTILFSDNRGSINLPEGLEVNWQDTLCRRALESGTRCSSNVNIDLPGSQAARELGLNTYVSVPILNREERLLGTLCGASGKSTEIANEALDVMEMLAQLIADQWERDRMYWESEKRAQQAEEHIRSRALFLAEAEHKLKSPLTVVNGWSQMLLENWQAFSDSERIEALEMICKSARQTARQVEELLDEARSEVLSNQLDPENLDLSALLKEVSAQLNGSTANHTVSFQCKLGLTVYADRTALWQVLVHLGENALKYSPDGGDVTFSATDDRELLTIKVADEGIGIPEDVDIFAAFTRGKDHADTRGTGLGLHIVRSIVQAMGGTVSCVRRPTKGSIFTVAFQRDANQGFQQQQQQH